MVIDLDIYKTCTDFLSFWNQSILVVFFCHFKKYIVGFVSVMSINSHMNVDCKVLYNVTPSCYNVIIRSSSSLLLTDVGINDKFKETFLCQNIIIFPSEGYVMFSCYVAT